MSRILLPKKLDSINLVYGNIQIMQNTLKSEIEKILSLPVTKREIEEYYKSNCKKGALKIGLEYERISLDSRAYEPAEYKNLSEIIRNFALVNEWELVVDSNIIIGAKDGFSSISLEPGGQFEISMEPKSTLDGILENLNHYVRQLDKLGEFYNNHNGNQQFALRTAGNLNGGKTNFLRQTSLEHSATNNEHTTEQDYVGIHQAGVSFFHSHNTGDGEVRGQNHSCKSDRNCFSNEEESYHH